MTVHFPRMPSSWAAWSLHLFGSSNLQPSPPPLGCVSSHLAPNRPAPLRSPAPASVLPMDPDPPTSTPLWTAPAWPPSRRTPAWTRTWTRRPWRRRSGGRRGRRLSAPSRTWRRKVWRVAARRRCCSDCRDNIRSTPRRRSAERTHLSTPAETRNQAGAGTAQISGSSFALGPRGENREEFLNWLCTKDAALLLCVCSKTRVTCLTGGRIKLHVLLSRCLLCVQTLVSVGIRPHCVFIGKSQFRLFVLFMWWRHKQTRRLLEAGSQTQRGPRIRDLVWFWSCLIHSIFTLSVARLVVFQSAHLHQVTEVTKEVFTWLKYQTESAWRHQQRHSPRVQLKNNLCSYWSALSLILPLVK